MNCVNGGDEKCMNYMYLHCLQGRNNFSVGLNGINIEVWLLQLPKSLFL